MTTPRAAAFIFDMDGTMVDNMDYHARAYIEFLARRSITITQEQFHQQASGKTNPEILRLLIGSHLSDDDCQTLGDEKEALYREMYGPHVQPVAGLRDFLEQTRRLGMAMALASSAPRENIDFVLDRLDLWTSFPVIVSAGDIRRGKPDPEIFLIAARRLDLPPERCIVFEDSRAGIEAARRAGMRVVVIATTLASDADTAALREQPHILQVARDFTLLDASHIARLAG